MSPNTRASRFLHGVMAGALCATALCSRPSLAAADRWDPVEPADLAATQSPIDPTAHAEILFDRCTVVDRAQSTDIQYYRRTKIYTQKGVEDVGVLSVDYPDETTIRDLVARVVKSDGTATELKKSEFVVTDVVRRMWHKWKKASLAVPGLEPGDIVECRWTEEWSGGLANFSPFCQRYIPVRECTYAIEASDSLGLEMTAQHVELAEQGRKWGKLFFRFENIPAFVEEDYMVPMRDVRGWVRVRFIIDESEQKRIYRNNCSWESEFRDHATPDREMKAKVTELLAGAASDDEKLGRIYEFCQNSVSNLSYFESSEMRDTMKRREKRDFELQTAKQTLAKGGFDREIDYLFAAMASAAGYKVRLMRNTGRDDMLNTRFPGGYALLTRTSIGVLVGDTWRYCSPGNPMLPFGMLDWEDEGALAIIGTMKEPEYEPLPVSRSDKSVVQRMGRFVLDEEGTLEGTVEETLTGHPAIELKEDNWGKPAAECRKEFEDVIMARLPTAEVTELSWARLKGGGFPVVLRYHMRVPAYASQVGERLLVAPSVFTAGRVPVFAAEKRVHPIMFSYAYTEQDDIRIQLPEGFALDQASAPGAVGSSEDVVSSTYRLRFSRRDRTLRYERTFTLDSPRILAFQATSYPALKSMFDGVHRSDTHAILVKPMEAVETSN